MRGFAAMGWPSIAAIIIRVVLRCPSDALTLSGLFSHSPLGYDGFWRNALMNSFAVLPPNDQIERGIYVAAPTSVFNPAFCG
jgi:hypothetical protein